MKEDNIDLFDSYLKGELKQSEKAEFEAKLKSDKELNNDFRIYIAIVDGICKENMQDEYDFVTAVKNLGKNEFKEAIGYRKYPKKWFSLKTKFIMTAVSAAAVVAIIFSGAISFINSTHRDNVDDLIVEYNSEYSDRSSSTDVATGDLSALQRNFEQISVTDIQSKQECGMRLAMAYLKRHDRKNAIIVLTQLVRLYPDDEVFVNKCNSIIEKLK